MAATPEGGVHIDAIGNRPLFTPQGLHRFVQQDRAVLQGGGLVRHGRQKEKSDRTWGMGWAITAASWAA